MGKLVPIFRRGIIHSIYLDDSTSSMYHSRLIRTDGSQLVRLRWYGDDEPAKDGKVFIEVKTHKEELPSMKERFSLSPTSAKSFEEGVCDAEVEVLPDAAKALANRVEALIKQRSLHRVLRSEYYRTAFQDPEHNDYRASLDQNITLEKEVKGGGWISSRHVEGNGFIFPYAVLELKVSMDKLETSNDQINSLITELKTAGVIEAQKFSKFLTGYSAHYSNQVNIAPSWMVREEIACAVRGESMSTITPMTLPPQNSAAQTITQVPQTYDRVIDHKENKKQGKADQKSIMANERTLLAWVRTTMILLYGSSFFLDHDVDGGIFNMVFGWSGIVCALGVLLWSSWRYNVRNQMLLRSENDLKKFIDQVGTNFLLASIVVVSIVGFASYSKSVLTYNNWHIYGEEARKAQDSG